MEQPAWPADLQINPDGTAALTDEDAARLQTAFAAYGVDMDVRAVSAEALGATYEAVVVGVGPILRLLIVTPCTARRFVDAMGWPEEWHDYLDALVRKDAAAVRAGAERLGLASGTREYPLPPKRP